jgi:hypothetical protein
LAAFAPPLRSGAASRQTQETLPERTDQTNPITPIRSQHRSLLKNRRPWLRYPGHLLANVPVRTLDVSQMNRPSLIPKFQRLAGDVLFAFLGSVLLSSCAHRSGPLQVGPVQTLRLMKSETYAVSVACECRDSGACTTRVMQRALNEGLEKRGIRQVPLQGASRTLVLHCREFPPGSRNELPLAPGSRLWYQRRIFAPTVLRTSAPRPTMGGLRIEIVVRPNPPADDNVRPRELVATTTVCSTSANDVRTAVEFLIASIQ